MVVPSRADLILVIIRRHLRRHPRHQRVFSDALFVNNVTQKVMDQFA